MTMTFMGFDYLTANFPDIECKRKKPNPPPEIEFGKRTGNDREQNAP